ncbi:MAG: hypothetical protein ABI784_10895 [Ginsengibacter sp.]
MNYVSLRAPKSSGSTIEGGASSRKFLRQMNSINPSSIADPGFAGRSPNMFGAGYIDMASNR